MRAEGRNSQLRRSRQLYSVSGHRIWAHVDLVPQRRLRTQTLFGQTRGTERLAETGGKRGRAIYTGKLAAIQHTNMANQIAIAGNMIGACECLAYARGAGLDVGAALKVIGTGAASSFLLNNLGPRMTQDDYQAGFYVHHFVKDLGIALAEAERMQLKLPGLALAKRLYEQLAEPGHAHDGTQAHASAVAIGVSANTTPYLAPLGRLTPTAPAPRPPPSNSQKIISQKELGGGPAYSSARIRRAARLRLARAGRRSASS